ncbi:hypothetical protein BD833_1082 [Blastococcus xanthinilyticus]|uniref:DUF6542 domain-containing protein n=1 Tax=Blastococcus xanthinilyticus TaxID=1564164 RepID=A0A5S5CS90_9ACTN|nr:hypothetical protein BD833_1082 [Blastococcus xanthinilyticus]
MATASTAGAWQGGGRPERPYPARAPRPVSRDERLARPSVPVPDRLRAAERERSRDRLDDPRAGAPRRGQPGPARPAGSRPAGPRPAAAPQAQPRNRDRASAPAPARDSKLRGSFAVALVFLLTLAGCAVDSFVGMGLGMITMVALAAGTVAAALLVRRRDLLTVVVAPPLVFVLVAVLNISLAPSATLNLPTMATLLVRGFPTMAVATAAAIVLSLVRLVSRR